MEAPSTVLKAPQPFGQPYAEVDLSRVGPAGLSTLWPQPDSASETAAPWRPVAPRTYLETRDGLQKRILRALTIQWTSR